jgi:NADPH:quinone reductase-like Zn-dependent oxidoreductase/mannose-6-phosphate isomerase-like protein (cupin superfamily)
MIRPGTVVQSPHTRIAFERTSAETDGILLRFEETFQVGTQRPPMHQHASQIERFTVLRGTLGVRVRRETRLLGPGEVVEVAAGTPHTLWNAGHDACVHRVEMMPALAMEDYFHEIVTLESEGGVPPKSLAHAARLARLFLRHRNQLSGLPWSLQRAFFRLVVLLSKWLPGSGAASAPSSELGAALLARSENASTGLAMGATYGAVMLTRKGGLKALDVLEVVKLPVQEPGPGQIRVRVRAAGVGSTDFNVVSGSYLFAPRIPFVPGYEIAAVVDALGPGVEGLTVGQRVAALTVHGGFGEMLVREAEHFVPIPDGVSDRDAAAVILNYVTAYQAIHRVGKAKAGQTALVTGAAGGVGTAALQLLRLAGVKTYGAASAGKHATLRALGAVPIDYRTGRLDRLVRALEPNGVDLVLDGIGGPMIGPCIGALRTGGRLVAYGFMAAHGGLSTVAMFANIFLGSRLRGRRGSFYGITALYRRDPKPFREDLPRIFALLSEKKIDPMVTKTFPLLEARRALELLAAGGVEGKVVLTEATA